MFRFDAGFRECSQVFESRFCSPPEVAKAMRVNTNKVRDYADLQMGHSTGNVMPAINTVTKFRKRLKIWGPDAEQFIRNCSAVEKAARQRRARATVASSAKDYLVD